MISQPWRKLASATLIMGLVCLSIRNMIFLPPVVYLSPKKKTISIKAYSKMQIIFTFYKSQNA